MRLEDFIIRVSAKCGDSKYIPPVNEEQFNQIVLKIQERKVNNSILLRECCKEFKLNHFDIWFIIKELS